MQTCIIHASCVAFGARAVLIAGPSGAGKSALALDLMALGAALVADDRTALTRQGDAVIARCPRAIRGRIEARGVGLLRAATRPQATLALVVDLAQDEACRLPPWRTTSLMGVSLPCIHRSVQTAFPAAVRQYIVSGRGG